MYSILLAFEQLVKIDAQSLVILFCVKSLKINTDIFVIDFNKEKKIVLHFLQREIKIKFGLRMFLGFVS